MYEYKRLMKWVNELRWNNLQIQTKKQSSKQYVTYIIMWFKAGERFAYILLICTCNFLIALSYYESYECTADSNN